MIINSNENFLEHAGVKGMRWGFRKKKEPPKRTTPRLSDEQKRKLKRAAVGTGVLVAGLGAAFARSPKGQAMMKQGLSKARDFQRRNDTEKFLNDLLRNMR